MRAGEGTWVGGGLVVLSLCCIGAALVVHRCCIGGASVLHRCKDCIAATPHRTSRYSLSGNLGFTLGGPS